RCAVSEYDAVLKEVARGAVHRALVALIDVHVVGDRSEVRDRLARFGENRARGFAVFGARRVELFERFEPRPDAGQLVLARADVAADRLAAAARDGQLRVLRRAIDLERRHGLAGAAERVFRGGALVG